MLRKKTVNVETTASETISMVQYKKFTNNRYYLPVSHIYSPQDISPLLGENAAHYSPVSICK